VDFLWQDRLDWTTHETLTGFTIADLSQRELIVWKDRNPTFGWPTQTLVDVLDLAPQIDHLRL
jgi:hypothetical protein